MSQRCSLYQNQGVVESFHLMFLFSTGNCHAIMQTMRLPQKRRVLIA